MSQPSRRPVSPAANRPVPPAHDNRQAFQVVGAVLGGLFVIVLGLVLLTTVGPLAVQPTPTPDPLAGVPLLPAPTPPWDPQQNRVPRITPPDLQARLPAATAPLVVDLRSQATWAEAHIPGAVSVPIDEFPTRIAELPQTRDIVLYCACGAEEESAHAGVLLLDQGYTRVWALKGGWDAWVAAGLPTDPPLPPTATPR